MRRKQKSSTGANLTRNQWIAIGVTGVAILTAIIVTIVFIVLHFRFSLPPTPLEIHEFETRVFELTNVERVNAGLNPLIWDDTLAYAARGHSVDLQYGRIERGHVGSDGSTVGQRIQRAGITNASMWSENVARGQTTPEQVVRAWMDSPGHRANILRAESTHLGVGFIQGGPGHGSDFNTAWTQKFIRLS